MRHHHSSVSFQADSQSAFNKFRTHQSLFFLPGNAKQRGKEKPVSISFNMADAGSEFLRSSLRNASFEQRFNCLICWTPSLRMIYGSCQHRLCENCLYDDEGNRRIGLEKCPTCQREDVFPLTRPDVPEDNMAIQHRLGVRRCPNNGCDLEMWYWELSDHIL